MNQDSTYNPNDYKVVVFHNKTDFLFTPEMGSMYGGRPITGVTGQNGIAAGEKLTTPYHIGVQLAINLAKQALIKASVGKPLKDAEGNPLIQALWSEEQLENLKNSYYEELYNDAPPVRESESDRMLRQFEAFKAELLAAVNAGKAPEAAPETVIDTTAAETAPVAPAEPVQTPPPAAQLGDSIVGKAESKIDGNTAPDPVTKPVFLDKADVMAELTKRGIKFEPTDSREKLEKLID